MFTYIPMIYTRVVLPASMSGEEDATARRLFETGGTRQLQTAEPTTRSTVAGVVRPPLSTAPTMLTESAQQHADAEQSLRYLEAEWAMRMEAPIAALASLEESVTLAIQRAHAALPNVTARMTQGAE